MARRYGTRHFAEEVTPVGRRPICRGWSSALDEPADPLSICLLHLARMTAREVKVVLGGDGGDELFGGYDRYAAERWLDAYRAVPEVVRDLVAGQVLGRLPDQFTFKSVTHKLRWVDLMARKTGGERYAESLQYFWFNEARRAELYTPGFRAQAGGPAADACLLELYARQATPTTPVDRMMYVDVDVAAAGAVAHDPRPGHDGVQPRVALAVPRSAFRRVHGARAGRRSRSGAAGSATSSAAWVSATCRPKCSGGRSRGSRRR